MAFIVSFVFLAFIGKQLGAIKVCRDFYKGFFIVSFVFLAFISKQIRPLMCWARATSFVSISKDLIESVRALRNLPLGKCT